MGYVRKVEEYRKELGNLPNLRRQLTETKNPLLVVCPGEFEDLCGRGHARAKLYRRACPK